MVEVKFSEIKSLIIKAFSNAKSRRTVKIEFAETYSVNDYWDGGSRNYCMFVDMLTGNVLSSGDIPTSMRQQMSNPFNLPISKVMLAPHIAIVENSIFCGKDMGYRVYLHPNFIIGDVVSEPIKKLIADNKPVKRLG
jgi:hypothetical protein